jgi:oligopeptide transport system ATP-binding protein
MIEQQLLVQVKNLKKYFPINRGIIFQKKVGNVKAVDDISFDIYRGETLGLVGESGCGKTTTGRCIVQLQHPTHGDVIYNGENLTHVDGKHLRMVRKNMQFIFQDPYASLNPRMTVSDIISEPIENYHLFDNAADIQNRVKELMSLVGLREDFINRYPHEFSGGQRQRIGIARAIATNPDFIVCDEPISALDVSIQAQIINLLRDLQKKLGLTYLFIAHDLSMVRFISNRIAVMYLGKIVELTTSRNLFENTLHPYSKALLSGVPVPDPVIEQKREPIILEGDVPSPIKPPSGCRFHTRCQYVMDICKEVDPEFIEYESGHFVACHLIK